MRRYKALLALVALGAVLATPPEMKPSPVMKRQDAPQTSQIQPSEESETVGFEITETIEPEELFTDFQTFIEWFAEVVIPWLVAFFTTGGAGVLIFKIAKMVASQVTVNKVVGQATDELNALRVKYAETVKAVEARDELLKALIDSQLNTQIRSDLQAKFEVLPKAAELETSKVTVKVKVRKKKAKEVKASANVSEEVSRTD